MTNESRVKIAVSLLVDGEPMWHLALDTNPKALTRLGMEEYTKVVRSAETELKNQIIKHEKALKSKDE
jgi:hypothetical protein